MRARRNVAGEPAIVDAHHLGRARHVFGREREGRAPFEEDRIDAAGELSGSHLRPGQILQDRDRALEFGGDAPNVVDGAAVFLVRPVREIQANDVDAGAQECAQRRGIAGGRSGRRNDFRALAREVAHVTFGSQEVRRADDPNAAGMRRRLSVAYVLSLFLHLLLVLFFGVHLLVPAVSSASSAARENETFAISAEERAVPATAPPPSPAPQPAQTAKAATPPPAVPPPQRVALRPRPTPVPRPKTQPPRPCPSARRPTQRAAAPELSRIAPDGTPEPAQIAVLAPIRTTPPTREPSPEPSERPTALPPAASPVPVATRPPTAPPTALPTAPPTAVPTRPPTAVPTLPPTPQPTLAPTVRPTLAPTLTPAPRPTLLAVRPTAPPTLPPTARPTVAPTARPTVAPTLRPTAAPTARPTAAPTARPTLRRPPRPRPRRLPLRRRVRPPPSAPDRRPRSDGSAHGPGDGGSHVACDGRSRHGGPRRRGRFRPGDVGGNEPPAASRAGSRRRQWSAAGPAGGASAGSYPGPGHGAGAANGQVAVVPVPQGRQAPAPIASGTLAKLNERLLSVIPGGSPVTYSQRHITNDLNAAVEEAEAEYFQAAAPPPEVLAKALYVIKVKSNLLMGPNIMYVLKKTTIMGFEICSGWYVQQLPSGPTGGYTVGPCNGEKFDPGSKALPGGLPNVPKPRPT